MIAYIIGSYSHSTYNYYILLGECLPSVLVGCILQLRYSETRDEFSSS